MSKTFFILISVILLLSCNKSTSITKKTSPVEEETIEKPDNEVIPVKESIFLTMERTRCYGECPSYKITIFNTGKVVYDGYVFATPKGMHTKRISAQQLTQIQDEMERIDLFNMKNTYDTGITDIPSVLLYVVYKGKKKKIVDRDSSPAKLTKFEKLIDAIIIDDNLKKMDQ